MQALIEKAKKIRLLLLDVDGVLTTGALHYGLHKEESKTFHVHDGLGIKLLQEAGIAVGIISSRDSAAVSERAKELGIQWIAQGQTKKETAFNQFQQALQLQEAEIAFMGDDLPDICVLKRAGFAIIPANATAGMREFADWQTTLSGGHGAVREVCEFILRAQNQWDNALRRFL